MLRIKGIGVIITMTDQSEMIVLENDKILDVYVDITVGDEPGYSKYDLRYYA